MVLRNAARRTYTFELKRFIVSDAQPYVAYIGSKLINCHLSVRLICVQNSIVWTVSVNARNLNARITKQDANTIKKNKNNSQNATNRRCARVN